MDNHFYAVIMAGGGGTRLWPLSRKSRPKQMLRLGSERTLFQIAVDRLMGLFPYERILVVTVAEQAVDLQKQCPQIPPENFLLEPMPRGTASVVGMAALALQHRDPDAVMAILTADHFIKNVPLFQRVLQAGASVARADYLVTLGIQPTFPATGYGYIQQGEFLGQHMELPIYRATRFHEKPDLATAQRFLDSGDHDWNSGMFIWKVATILAEIRQHMPELAAVLDRLDAAWDTPARNLELLAVWPGIKPETVDYGIMEKSRRVAVLPARGLGWDDVGSWASLFDVMPADENGNIILDARHLSLATKDSLVCAEDPEKLIVTIGLQGVIVVQTHDAILICRRDDAQRVKEIVNLLKETGQSKYL